jgi:hypothetical protein
MLDREPSTREEAVAFEARNAADEVSFGLESPLDYNKIGSFREAERVRARVTVVVVATALLAPIAIMRWFGVSVTSSGLLILLPALLVGFLAWEAWPTIARKWFVHRNRGKLPRHPDSESRLQCVGAPQELAEFGEFQDVPFPPRLFYAGFSIRPSRRATVTYYLLGGFFLVTFQGLSRAAGIPFNFGGLALHLLLSAGLAELGTAFLWPVYFRLVPGRLDIVRYGPQKRNKREVYSLDLSRARVVADLRKSFVLVDADPKRAEFGIALIREKCLFAHTLFLAAISSATPVELPEDTLVG